MTPVDLNISVDDHPQLDLGTLAVEFDCGLGSTPSPAWLVELLHVDAASPLEPSDEVRARVRDLLRHGGYKPTGRGKPSSEYLVRAATEGKLPSINLAVDLCNVVSLHSGLPISVVDMDRVSGALHVGLAESDAEFVFNLTEQTIRVGGLLCLHDDDGACANAVKDSQRTKTGDETTRALSLCWGTRELAGRTALAVEWYRELVTRVAADSAGGGVRLL